MVILCWSSCLGFGTIVGVFHPARQLARFSPPNMPYILNYRPYVSPSFEVASHVKNCHFGDFYYYYVKYAFFIYLFSQLVLHLNIENCIKFVHDGDKPTLFLIVFFRSSDNYVCTQPYIVTRYMTTSRIVM